MNSGSLNENREKIASALSGMGYALRFFWIPASPGIDECQEGIGLAMEWNEGAKWWQPYLIFHFRHKRWQVGWLYEGDRENA